MPTRADDAHVYDFLAGLESGTKSIPGALPGLPAYAPMREMVHPAYGGTGGYGSNWLRKFLPGSDYDYEVQAGDLWRNSATAACLRVYKANFPQPELQVRKRKAKAQDQVVAGHPVVQLLNRPTKGYDAENTTGGYDRFGLWSSFCLAAICDGNAYLVKIRSRAGIPVQLWWIPPWMLRPIWRYDGSEYITAYQYIVNGRVFAIRPQDIIHYRHGGPDPRNDRVAMSELKSAAARSVCGLNECDGFTATIMRNMGIVPFVIAPAFEGGRIGVDEADQMREQWRERTTGEQRGFPWINPGSFKVEKLGGTPEEMALDKIPARFEDQISALTGVPAMVAGLTSGAQHRTYANWGEARRAFYEDTLIPMQAAVAECLEHNLLDDPGMGNSETETIAFSYDRILCLREDQNAIWTRGALAYEKGGIKRSEYRDMIGLDWDDEDDVYFVEPGGTGDGIDPSEENQGVVGDTADDDTKRETDEDEDAQGAAKKALALMGPRRNGHAHVKDPLMATVGRVLSKIEERMGREL